MDNFKRETAQLLKVQYQIFYISLHLISTKISKMS